MKVTAQAFSQAIATHVAQTIIPQVSNPMTQWALAGAVATGSIARRATPLLTMVGVMDADGDVDVDALDTFINGAFAQTPKVTIPFLGLTFEQADAEAFAKRLRG